MDAARSRLLAAMRTRLKANARKVPLASQPATEAHFEVLRSARQYQQQEKHVADSRRTGSHYPYIIDKLLIYLNSNMSLIDNTSIDAPAIHD